MNIKILHERLCICKRTKAFLSLINTRLTVLFVCLLLTPTIHAQEHTLLQILEQAEEQYNIGNIEQSQQLLKDNLPLFQGPQRVGAYRLLSICSLAEDNELEAREYAYLLLQNNPFYVPSISDPQLFIELVNTLKAGRLNTITTASQQTESLEEAPVPVTLITEEMIRLSTARNLQELLADYVPGISIQDGSEANLGIRGVIGSLPEYLLLMRDGVRMNSYLNYSAPPDFRISLANIKQIEVLRGAASSLYGNTALMAVVNIVTKDGGDVDGLQLTAGAGNGHTLKADMLLGKQMFESNLLIWGSIYNSKGTRYDVSRSDSIDFYTFDSEKNDGYFYAGGYNQKPCYDLGLSYTYKDFNFYVSHQHGKRVSPYTIDIASVYPYDDFETVGGMKPGYSTTLTLARMKYSHSWKRVTLEVNTSANIESSTHYEGEETDWWVNTDNGLNTISADAKGFFHYSAGRWGKGNLLLGMQIESSQWDNHYQLTNFLGQLLIGTRSPSRENTISPFMQIKHTFSPKLILNAGLRYDFRDRSIIENIQELSPRIAMIWMPSKQMNFKLTYGHSFVDLTREEQEYPALDSLPINPHRLDNITLASSFSIPRLNLRYESSLLLNKVSRVKNSMLLLLDTSIKNLGWENVLTYEQPGMKARLTAYLQHVISSKSRNLLALLDSDNDTSLGNTGGDVMINMQLSKRICKGLWTTLKGSYVSKHTFTESYLLLPGISSQYIDKDDPTIVKINIPANFLMDFSVGYTWKNLKASLVCKNLFNRKYRLVGERLLYLQQGRMALGTITYTFK